MYSSRELNYTPMLPQPTASRSHLGLDYASDMRDIPLTLWSGVEYLRLPTELTAVWRPSASLLALGRRHLNVHVGPRRVYCHHDGKTSLCQFEDQRMHRNESERSDDQCMMLDCRYDVDTVTVSSCLTPVRPQASGLLCAVCSC